MCTYFRCRTREGTAEPNGLTGASYQGPPGSKVATRDLRRLLGAAIVLIGAILLIAALLAPWYSYDYQFAGGTAGDRGTQNSTYFLGLSGANGTIHETCSGRGGCPSQTSYSSGGRSNTGSIAEISFALLFGGFGLGIAAGTIGVASRGRHNWTFSVVALAVLALVVATTAPALFAVALPNAFSKDLPQAGCGGRVTGPWSSFYGSETSSCSFVGFSGNWGPMIGWYLSLTASAVLGAGVIVLLLFRHDPAGPAPVSFSLGSTTSPEPS